MKGDKRVRLPADDFLEGGLTTGRQEGTALGYSSPRLSFRNSSGWRLRMSRAPTALRKELGWDAARSRLAELTSRPIETATVAWSHAWPLARDSRLTLYDAAYLRLARRRRLSLLTFDPALQLAAAPRSLQ